MCPVSTKFHSKPLERCGSAATPPPTTPTEACFSLKRLDCSRVLTTSNGLVMMAPHIPPKLTSWKHVKKESMLYAYEVWAHPPATKCCHDFDGRRLLDAVGFVVVGGAPAIISNILPKKKKSKIQRTVMNKQKLEGKRRGAILSDANFFITRHVVSEK